MKFAALLLVILLQFIFVPVPKVYAATSPTLGAAGSYSVLGGQTITNTGTTTMVQVFGFLDPRQILSPQVLQM